MDHTKVLLNAPINTELHQDFFAKSPVKHLGHNRIIYPPSLMDQTKVQQVTNNKIMIFSQLWSKEYQNLCTLIERHIHYTENTAFQITVGLQVHISSLLKFLTQIYIE